MTAAHWRGIRRHGHRVDGPGGATVAPGPIPSRSRASSRRAAGQVVPPNCATRIAAMPDRRGVAQGIAPGRDGCQAARNPRGKGGRRGFSSPVPALHRSCNARKCSCAAIVADRIPPVARRALIRQTPKPPDRGAMPGGRARRGTIRSAWGEGAGPVAIEAPVQGRPCNRTPVPIRHGRGGPCGFPRPGCAPLQARPAATREDVR